MRTKTFARDSGLALLSLGLIASGGCYGSGKEELEPIVAVQDIGYSGVREPCRQIDEQILAMDASTNISDESYSELYRSARSLTMGTFAKIATGADISEKELVLKKLEDVRIRLSECPDPYCAKVIGLDIAEIQRRSASR